MKRTLLALMVLLTISNSVQALSWAYGFVVWDGKVYEVKQGEVVEERDIGKVIGEVKTKPNDMTGSYYGNASNYYPIGTKYAEIKSIPTSEAIAVEEGEQWVKAVFVYEASFHIMNVLTNPLILLGIGAVGLVIGSLNVSKRKRFGFNH